MRIINALLLIAAVSIIGCGGIRVDTDYDKQYDYSSLSKYSWIEMDMDEKSNVLITRPDVYERARIAVNRALFEKGYKLAIDEEPDFLVDVYLDIEVVKNVIDNRAGGRETTGGDRDFIESTVNEGTLIVDIITPDESYVIWRGTGMDEVRDPVEGEKKEDKQLRADFILYEILKEFPPDLD